LKLILIITKEGVYYAESKKLLIAMIAVLTALSIPGARVLKWVVEIITYRNVLEEHSKQEVSHVQL